MMLDMLRNNFLEKGYVHVECILTNEDLLLLSRAHEQLLHEAQKILRNASQKHCNLAEFYSKSQNDLIVVPERDHPSEICRFEYIAGISEDIKCFLDAKIKPMIDFIMQEPFVLFKDKCNEKAPGGGAFPPHQDFAAYKSFPPRFYITVMIPLDDSNLVNGCLQFAQKYQQLAESHPEFVNAYFGRYPLLNYYDSGVDNGSIHNEIKSLLFWKPIPTKMKDIVIFDAFVPHCSEPNQSDTFRRAFFITYNAMKEGNWYDQYYITKRAAYDSPMFHVATPTRRK